MKEKAPESNISASKIQLILTEIEKIKTQVANVVESRQTSSANRVLEEVTILRASNNSITDALEKLSKEWAAIQMKVQTEFTKVQKSITSNSNQVKEVQQLVKKMQFYIARLAKVDPKEIMKEIQVESSHQEVQKSTPQQSSATPITKARTTMMGPPPNVLKDEMRKRLATSKPQVITNVKLITSQTVPKPTISNDSAMSKVMNLQTIKEWEQEANSRKPQIVKRKSLKLSLS
ncbi:hypothetical protein Hanom_Chr16g01451381 [Helianthus anomalus]